MFTSSIWAEELKIFVTVCCRLGLKVGVGLDGGRKKKKGPEGLSKSLALICFDLKWRRTRSDMRDCWLKTRKS